MCISWTIKCLILLMRGATMKFFDFSLRYNQWLPKFVCHRHTELKFPVNLTTYPTPDHINYITDHWLSCFHFTTKVTTKTIDVLMRGQLSIISAIFLVLPTSSLTKTKTDLHLFTFLVHTLDL